ncbi:hypothetical protein M3Y95_00344500 [Aphelenchoides besseyi]|nr:hypothetical protein M3Y95_00344500 [Aphelenchoides besseyi]
MQSIAWNMTDICTRSKIFRSNPWLRSIVGVHVLVSVLSIVVLWLFLRSRGMRKASGLVSQNLKIIVVVGIFYFFLSAFWNIGFYSYKLSTMFTNGPDCHYVWRGLSCYLMYVIPASFCVLGNSLFHLMLLIERTVATFSSSNSHSSLALGWISGLILIVLPILFNSMKDFSVYIPDVAYCSNIVTRQEALTNSKTVNVVIGMIIFDLLITFGDLLLYVYNKYERAKYRRRISDNYTLNKSFNLREFEITISLILPFSLLHSLGYSTQLIWYVDYVYQMNMNFLEYSIIYIELLNMFRTLHILLIAGILWIYNSYKTKEPMRLVTSQAAETYFLEFKRMIA